MQFFIILVGHWGTKPASVETTYVVRYIIIPLRRATVARRRVSFTIEVRMWNAQGVNYSEQIITV